MKTIVLGILALGVVATPVHGTEYLQTLKEGSWLCDTPQSYDRAVAEQRSANGDLEALKKRLLDAKQCIYIDGDFVERMMVPYAKVLERQDGKVKVTFTVKFRKRVEFRRQASWVNFVGWTDAANLLDKEIL
jgi:hypothetical protein